MQETIYDADRSFGIDGNKRTSESISSGRNIYIVNIKADDGDIMDEYPALLGGGERATHKKEGNVSRRFRKGVYSSAWASGSMCINKHRKRHKTRWSDEMNKLIMSRLRGEQ